MAVRPGERTVYVAEQTGRVRAISNGRLDPDPVPDVSSQIVAGGEQGLLGLAFSPEGRFLYVDFTDRNGDTHGRAKANTGWNIGTRRSRRNRGHASPTSRTTAARAGGHAGPRQPAL
jgi:hypothetical protein